MKKYKIAHRFVKFPGNVFEKGEELDIVEDPDGAWVKWEDVNWISVKDRLPSKDASYIIHAPSLDKKSPFITCAWYDPNLPGWSMLPECWLKAITHWMPLPEAPKE